MFEAEAGGGFKAEAVIIFGIAHQKNGSIAQFSGYPEALSD
ncbi:hypothetical protein SDC9_151508 [bioreactor metagenome]|uniref:Uncharacterized protein n=1 Tax=bioreactor metagenome TaxID=1076179 RepID=A0A645ESL0_9ZZZZ